MKAPARYILLFFLLFTTNLCLARSAFTEAQYPYIVNTVKILGFVTGLAWVKSAPNFLFAMVRPDGKPKPHEKYGIYIFDIKEPLKPQQIGYYPINYPRGMSLTPDGKTFFVNGWFSYDSSSNQDIQYGIIALDVSDPYKPVEIAHLNTNAATVHLSHDGKLLFFKEMWIKVVDAQTIRQEDKKGVIQIYDVANPKIPNKIATLHIEDSADADSFATARDNNRLLVRDSISRIILYDISNLTEPKMVYNLDQYSHIGIQMISGKSNRSYFVADNQFFIFDIEPAFKQIGAFYAGSVHSIFISDDEKTAIVPRLKKSVTLVDISDPSLPKEIADYPVPEYPGTVMQIKANDIIYVGLIGALIVVKPVKEWLDAKGLIAAHKAALAAYYTKSKKGLEYLLREVNAIHLLDAAGIKEALRNKPGNMSSKQYAHILNDYAFFKMQHYENKEAIDILGKVILSDPARAVAYLNIGDALRAELAGAKNFNQKIEMTKEIEAFYKKYKTLTGKTTADMDKFLSFNIVNSPPENICNYIADYINQGRTRELFGASGSIDLNNDGVEELVGFDSGGTMGITYITVHNKETGESISVPDADRDFNGSWAYEIAVVPFKNEYYLLHYNSDRYPVVATQISNDFTEHLACRFDVSLKEKVGNKSTDKKLCAALADDKPPSYLEFNETHSIDRDVLTEKLKRYETSAGEALSVDFDNDGTKESVIEFQYASGAGRGCEYTYFDLLNSKKDNISFDKKRELLMEMQDMQEEKYLRSRFPVPHCSGNTTGWFIHNNTVYYESKYRMLPPINEGQEFHTVAYIKNGKINQVCEYEFEPVVHVRK